LRLSTFYVTRSSAIYLERAGEHMDFPSIYEELFNKALRIRLVEERIIKLYPRTKSKVLFTCLSGKRLWQ
jgi:hypothetical protein